MHFVHFPLSILDKFQILRSSFSSFFQNCEWFNQTLFIKHCGNFKIVFLLYSLCGMIQKSAFQIQEFQLVFFLQPVYLLGVPQNIPQSGKFFWEELNVGTVPTFKMHNIGTVPTFKMHNVGTVPTYKMYNIGTVPTFKMHNVGTLFFLLSKPQLNHNSTRPYITLSWVRILKSEWSLTKN